MSNIDKQALRGQSVEGSFYLAECGHCGEMYPSNKLNGGEPLFSGDYGECFCHLCGADDNDIADCGAWGSEGVTAWNYQQKRIEALLDELEPMALAHLNLNLLCDVYRSAYEEARHDGLVNWEAAASLTEENGDLNRNLEAAEKRIAELEAREVKFPEALVPAIHNSGEPFMRPEPFGLYLNRDDVLKALRAAGIGKGE